MKFILSKVYINILVYANCNVATVMKKPCHRYIKKNCVHAQHADIKNGFTIVRAMTRSFEEMIPGMRYQGFKVVWKKMA